MQRMQSAIVNQCFAGLSFELPFNFQCFSLMFQFSYLKKSNFFFEFLAMK